MTHEIARFTAVVFSRQARGEEMFWAEVRMAHAQPRGFQTVYRAAQENCQAVLCQVLDWSRRQGKQLAWEYQLAKDTTMKRLISSGPVSLVGPPAVQGAAAAAPNAAGPAAFVPKLNAALSPQQSERLFNCETVIREGLETFVEVGNALAEIREGKLYRHFGHDTFEEYVKDRWGMSVRHAHRLVDSAEIASNLLEPPKPAGGAPVTNWSPLPAPGNESQLRPLKGLEPAEQRQVWAQAAKASGGQVTAKAVEEARAKLHPAQVEIEVMFVRVAQGGDIDSTNCHDQLARGFVIPELRKAFGHKGRLWVVSVGHYGGSPGHQVVTQEAHALLPAQDDWDNGDPPKGVQGRRALWKGQKMRLGPTVIFKGFQDHNQERLEEDERGERATRTVAVEMSRADDGDISQAYSADLMRAHLKPPYKIRQPFQFEGKLWTVSGGVHGRHADGIVEQRGHELIPESDYAGPERRPHYYEGALVKWKDQHYHLGPLVVFRAQEKQKDFTLEAQAVRPGSDLERIRLTVDQFIKSATSLREELPPGALSKKQAFHLEVGLTHLKNFRGSLDQKTDPSRQAEETRQRQNSRARKEAARKALVAAKRWKAAKRSVQKPGRSGNPGAEQKPPAAAGGAELVIWREGVGPDHGDFFLTAAGGWTPHLGKAQKFRNATEAKLRLGRRAGNIIKASRAAKMGAGQ